MNPFKHKQIEEFTIADCELYISKYPYGEHFIEVKRHLKELAKAQQDKPKECTRKSETEKINKPQSEGIKDSGNVVSSAAQTNTSNDVVKTIFVWIGIIVVVLVVGTIIITLLNEILPYNWWNKYRYIIYPAGLALGRWLQKEFNW